MRTERERQLPEFTCLKMEDKYSSNVLSGGKLGMVEVPNSRYECVITHRSLQLESMCEI